MGKGKRGTRHLKAAQVPARTRQEAARRLIRGLIGLAPARRPSPARRLPRIDPCFVQEAQRLIDAPVPQCAACRRPLSYNMYLAGETQLVEYFHPEEGADHEPELLLAARDLSTVECDFCLTKNPRFAYVVRNAEPLRLLRASEGLLVQYEPVWFACDRCEPLVTRGQLNRLLDRVVFFSPYGGTRSEKANARSSAKRLFEVLLRSDLHGPVSLES